MIKGVYLKNFKCHKELTLEFRPLTLLFGPNGSGKSAVIQSLLLLKQTAHTPLGDALTLKGEFGDFGSYYDIIFLHKDKRHLSIGVLTDIEGTERKKKIKLKLLSINWSFRKDRHGNIVLHRVKSTIMHRNLVYTAQITFKGEGFFRPFLLPSGGEGLFSPAQFDYKVMPHSGQLRPLILSFLRETNFYYSVIFANKVGYIGKIRLPFARIEALTTSKQIGPSGEFTASVIANVFHAQEGNVEIQRKMRTILRDMKLADDISVNVERLPSSEKRAVIINVLKNNVWVNIADAWSGLHQALPLIIQGLTAPEDSLLLWEQPEIHLHPRAQLAMGDFLLEASKNKTLVVETHSDLILGRILRRIAEKPELRERIAMYYFDKRGPEAEVTELKIDEYGQIENAPEGFFEEGYQEASAHVEAIEERQSEE